MSEVRATLETLSIDGSPVGALNGSLVDSFRRFLHTWDLAKDLTGKALELGENPLFTTWLLTDFTELDLQTANYFGSVDSSGQQTVTMQARGQERVIPFRFDHFNIEDDRFPCEEATFDVVFFCEIPEHSGFRIERRFTADSFPFDHHARLGTRTMRKLLKGREETLRQYHFFRSRKTGQPTPGLPGWLFRDFPADQMSR